MLVDINLLPQKKKKVRTFQYLLSFILLFFLMGMTSLFYIKSEMENDLKTLQQEQLQYETERQMLEGKQLSRKTESASEAKTSLVDKLEAHTLSTGNVVDHFVSLLPKSGYFLDVTYESSGSIIIEAEFQSIEETSLFLDRLYHSPSVKEVTLQDVMTQGSTSLTESQNVQQTIETIKYVATFNIKFDPQFFLQQEGEVE